MSEYALNKIKEAYEESKNIRYINIPELESFARGTEHGLHLALLHVKDDQATNCAGCGVFKYTPLRRSELGGYVCLTCIDKHINNLIENQAM